MLDNTYNSTISSGMKAEVIQIKFIKKISLAPITPSYSPERSPRFIETITIQETYESHDLNCGLDEYSVDYSRRFCFKDGARESPPPPIVVAVKNNNNYDRQLSPVTRDIKDVRDIVEEEEDNDDEDENMFGIGRRETGLNASTYFDRRMSSRERPPKTDTIPSPPPTQSSGETVRKGSASDIAALKTFRPPSLEERRKVNELLQLCSKQPMSYEFNSTSSLRFLRDKRGDVPKAFEAMIRHCEWRKANNVDNITAAEIQLELAKKVLVQHGFDRENRPVLYALPRNHDSKNRDLESLRKLIIYLIEQALLVSKPEEQRLTIVADLSNFGFKNLDYEFVRMAISILQTNYPETMNVALVCNAPFIFNAIYTVIKPWLDPVTAAKVSFIRTNKLVDYLEESLTPPNIVAFPLR